MSDKNIPKCAECLEELQYLEDTTMRLEGVEMDCETWRCLTCPNERLPVMKRTIHVLKGAFGAGALL